VSARARRGGRQGFGRQICRISLLLTKALRGQPKKSEPERPGLRSPGQRPGTRCSITAGSPVGATWRGVTQMAITPFQG